MIERKSILGLEMEDLLEAPKKEKDKTEKEEEV
jgi:hypothetical protein